MGLYSLKGLPFFFFLDDTTSSYQSAFGNTLLRSLSWILYRCLGLKPDRRRWEGTVEIEEAEIVLSGARKSWLVQEKKVLTRKWSLEVFCTESAEKVHYFTLQFSCWRRLTASHTEAEPLSVSYKVTVLFSSHRTQCWGVTTHHPQWLENKQFLPIPVY